MKLLIDNGADVCAELNYGHTLLMRAAKGGNLEIVKLLIDKGADVNAKVRHGKTVLMFAARGGNLDVVRFLLEKGLKVNARDEIWRDFSHDCRQIGPLGCGQAPGRQESDVNAKTSFGRTALKIAQWRPRDREIVEFLKAHGAKNEL